MIHAERIKRAKRLAAGGRMPPHRPDFEALFNAVPDPCLVLDRELMIVAVNDTYLEVTRTSRDDIVGRGMFEVFPDNPEDPSATGATNLTLSLRRVLQNKVEDTMSVQRYDIPVADGSFEERYWNTTNTPVFGYNREVLYIIHRVQDITDFVHLKQERMKEQQISRELQEKSEMELYHASIQMAEKNRELKKALEALHESQQLFNSFMAKLPAAAWIKDLQGRYVFANPQMGALFNTSVPQLMGKRGEDVFPAQLADQFQQSDRLIVEQGGSDRPFAVVREAGEGERYLMVSKFPIPGPDGKPEYVAGLAFDVTENRKMEAEIERLATYPMLNPNPVIEMDQEGRAIFCNPVAQQILEKAGLAEDSRNPFIPEDLREIVQVLLEHRVPQYFREVEIEGRYFEELLMLVPPQNNVRCYTMEITKRKEAQRERERVLLQLEAVLESITEGVVISDLEGNLIAMNREALFLHEYGSVEEVRQHVSEFRQSYELFDFEGNSVGFDQWPLMRAVHGERFFDYQALVHNRRSDRTWIGNYSGTPVTDKNGKPILAVITVRDVTDRKKMEAEINKLNSDLAARVSELESFTQELEAFNRMVSHDLRQPLNTIGTSCQAIEMLCGDRLGGDCNRYVRIAYNKVLAMNELIASLLKFSRSTHSDLNREQVNLSEMARTVMTEVRIAEPGRRVSFKVAEGVTAYGDATLLRSVLENLIGNAWKYTGHREEAVIEFGATQMNGEETYFVKDNGSGFDMAESEKLFTPFKRLPGAEEFRGTGIGLATVDRIIRRHGGHVWAEGEPGKGATFYFTLPAEEGARPEGERS